MTIVVLLVYFMERSLTTLLVNEYVTFLLVFWMKKVHTIVSFVTEFFFLNLCFHCVPTARYFWLRHWILKPTFITFGHMTRVSLESPVRMPIRTYDVLMLQKKTETGPLRYGKIPILREREREIDLCKQGCLEEIESIEHASKRGNFATKGKASTLSLSHEGKSNTFCYACNKFLWTLRTK